ncbi:MAG TPA: AMP-binding protein [Candidatus Xenobia bacterium]|nr:AMP-binding protein [Candidatus Xenobia bacterium]
MNNLFEHFATAAARFGGRVAVEVQRRDSLESVTYSELRRCAECVAGYLNGIGVGPGERCAILAENDARWCAALWGILRLGAVAVPLDTNYKPDQVARLLQDSGARALLTTPRFAEVARQAVAGLPVPVALLHGQAQAFASLDVVFQSAPPTLAPCPAMPADPAMVMYTSGTTADPKGVVLTHGNLLAVVEVVPGVFNVNENDSLLGVLPLFHSLALVVNLLLPFSVGGCVVFLETVNTTELMKALAEREITIFCVVPQFFYLIRERVWKEVERAGRLRRTAFRLLLSLNGWTRRLGLNLGRVFFRPVHAIFGRKMRYMVSGGSRFDPAIQRDFHRLGLDIMQGYGLTECSGPATVTPLDDIVFGSVGKPIPGVEVKILPPESGADREAGDGEVAIRGATVMPGYFNRPDATAEALKDGWLLSGDLGYLDAHGRLFITGRKKEIIVLSSGKNIYPEEIEAHYQQSPFIKEICVLGLTGDEQGAGERLHAVVVPDFDALRARTVVNTKEILRYEIEGLGVHLPSHKRVLSYEIWTEDLPRTTTRKLKRSVIEARVREKKQGVEAAASPRTLTAEDQVWMADPFVARAVALIREASPTRQDVYPNANIELDLGFDSMERVELLTQLEREFGVDVPEEVAARIYTVRELVEAVRPHPEAAGRPEGGRAPAWAELLRASTVDPEIERLLAPRPVTTLLLFVAVKLLYALMKIFCLFRVGGREHLPPAGPFLLCPNHQSYLDPFFLVAALPYRIFRQVFFVGASEYFATPLMRWVARLVNLIPVDPDTNLVRAMQAGAFGLRNGKVLILFPEGERSIDGTVRKFKKGASILSQHLQVPIVPVALDGLHHVWPRGKNPQRLARVALCFGPLIPPPPATPAEAADAETSYAAAAEKLRAQVDEMWRQLNTQRTG